VRFDDAFGRFDAIVISMGEGLAMRMVFTGIVALQIGGMFAPAGWEIIAVHLCGRWPVG
jgi:hypothetical protein